MRTPLQQYRHDNYMKAKAAHPTAHVAYARKRRDKTREWLDEQKDTPCTRCGKRYPPHVMDFHHRDPAEKSFTIGAGGSINVAKARMEAEVAKCDVYCANCHRIIEHEARRVR